MSCILTSKEDCFAVSNVQSWISKGTGKLCVKRLELFSSSFHSGKNIFCF